MDSIKWAREQLRDERLLPLAYGPGTSDHYRPRQTEVALIRAYRIAKLMAPDDPMLFVRVRRLQPQGASLN